MRTFLTVLKNNYLRTAPRIVPLIFITAVTLASIMLAVYMTGIQQVKGHVVFVTQDVSESFPQSKYLDVTVLPEAPPMSSLVEQKYDAYVTKDADGSYSIETLRNDDFKNMLQLLLKNPEASGVNSKTERGVGVNILGFIMMFLLMMSLSNMFAFADDKEQGQLLRIAASPASFGAYLAAHCVYCLSFVLPDYIMLVILKCCGWDIGFNLLQYAALLSALMFLGISFALLLNTFFRKPDNANMLGNSLTVLTSVLAGSFYSFSKDNKVLDSIIKILPQKDLMDFAQHMQNGSTSGHFGSIGYVILFSVALFVFSCVVLRSKYVKKV
jgi:ABC-2 type transport system permease protein